MNPQDHATTVAALHAVYERRAAEAEPGSDDDWRRNHLGCSIAGHKCDRYLWLSFRWAAKKQSDGRMLRLLERGKREELWLLEDLEAAGVTVWCVDAETDEQFRLRWGHIGGSVDGFVVGLAESHGKHVFEAKTTNAKGYARLQEYGVKRAKPEHWTQIQLYMLGFGVDRAFYVAVCKDNDHIYSEVVKFDEKAAVAARDRLERITLMDAPPERMDAQFPPCMLTSKDGKQYPCDFYDLCHGSAWPEPSCRTCISATPREDGRWICSHHAKHIDGTEQRIGCDKRITVPGIANAQIVEADEKTRRVVWQMHDGRQVVEG